MTLTGEPTRTVFETPVPHPCDLAWSPDGSHLAIIGATEGGSDRGTGYLALVDASGETAWRWSTTNNTYEAVAWSPDGTILALAGARGDIELRSVVDASLLGRLHGHEKRILRLAWSPDGRHLASASFDGTVQVRNVRARTCERIFREHGSFVMALAWSPDGATLASGAKDRRVLLWSPATGAIEGALYGHEDTIWCLDWSPDGSRLVSSAKDKDGTLICWSREGERLWQAGDHNAYPHSASASRGAGIWRACWSPCGAYIASMAGAGGPLEIRSAEDGTRLHTSNALTKTVAWSPCGSRLAGFAGDGNTAFLEVSEATSRPRIVPEIGTPRAPSALSDLDPTAPRETTWLDGIGPGWLGERAELVELPRALVVDALHSADAAGHLLAPRNPGFAEALEALGLSWAGLLEQQEERAPCRLRIIAQGLMKGAWLLPDQGDHAWLALPEDTGFRPLDVPERADLVISYAREDRTAALDLRAALEGAGSRVFMIDVEKDPEDPIWWARFGAAMRAAKRFVPVISEHYLARLGSAAEYEEERTLLRARSDSLQWSGMLPVLTCRELGALQPSSRALLEHPCWPIDEEEGLERFVAFTLALHRADQGATEAIRSILEREAERAPSFEGATVVDYRWPLPNGSGALVRVAGEHVRVMAQEPSRRPRALPKRHGVSGALEKIGLNLEKQGRPREAARVVASFLAREGLDFSGLFRLCVALDEADQPGDACVAFREASLFMHNRHPQASQDRIRQGLERLGWLEPFMEGRCIADVLDVHRHQVERRPEIRIEVDADLDSLDLGGSTKRDIDRFQAEYEAGAFEQARLVGIASFHRAEFDTGKGTHLSLAALAAAAGGDLDLGRHLAAIALDYNPTADFAHRVLQVEG